MGMTKGSLMKIDQVLDIARKDPRFLNDLTRDPARTLDESAIDLSRGELVALLDIVKDTSHSTLAPALGPAKSRFKSIVEELGKGYGPK